jgi:alkanesulfonate monooxygenase SsuD/methylene tetrahydromethanopterin reductase-like flavin-dependent oxidoreductase (luciferase family)
MRESPADLSLFRADYLPIDVTELRAFSPVDRAKGRSPGPPAGNGRILGTSLNLVTSGGFRFGVVATPQVGGQDVAGNWQRQARRAEELGYSSVLMPDGVQLPSPMATLAFAAAVTTALRVGTFVLASPLRPPALTAWEAHSMSVLTRGRFEFGIGTGHPGNVRQAVDVIGMPETTAPERLDQVERSIDRLRELDGDRHTPVLMAVSGPKAMAVAAAKADIVTIAIGPLRSRADMARSADELRAAAGSRAGSLELLLNVFVIGDDVPAWMQRFLGADAATLIEHDSLTMLRGSVQEMADELQRRRDAFGTSYVAVNGAFTEQFARVVELLTGH